MSHCTHLIVGCGYLGRRVATRWQAAGRQVAATTRSETRARQFAEQGLTAVVGDITDAATLNTFPPAETILFAVGFDRNANQSIDNVYVNGLANVLAALPEPPQRFIYISSTGVYGQTDGSWVNEDSECKPTRAGGKACLAAEQLLLESSIADRCVILRCAGLYGPGRIPRLSDVQSQTPIAANPDVCLNLIHIDDAADIVCQVADAKPASQLYLVSDGNPAPRRDFYQHLAELNDLPLPTFVPPEDASDSRRAGGDNKRIDNRRLITEVQPRLQYPSYREGLR